MTESEYERLAAEARREMGIINARIHREIFEYLLGWYSDEGVPPKVIESAYNEAMEEMLKSEEKIRQEWERQEQI